MPSGTTANEAVHAQINAWYRNQAAWYSTTAELELRCATLGKLLIHGLAMNSPLMRQDITASGSEQIVSDAHDLPFAFSKATSAPFVC